LALVIGQMARPGFTKEKPNPPTVKRERKNSDLKERKAIKRLDQNEQQIIGERKVAVQSESVNFAQLAEQEALKPFVSQEKHYVPEPQEEENTEAKERPIPPNAQVYSESRSLLLSPEPFTPSPSLSASFRGAAATGWIPPDTQGAVGASYLMVAVNGGVLVQSKTGTTLSSVSLSTFFSSIANGSTDIFDPRIQYDPYGNRWILIATADRDSAASAIMVGVSQTSDPTGNWYLKRVDADSANQSWADYPILGFNKNWIVVSANMFANSGTTTPFYSRFFVLNKANFYAGGNTYTQLSAPNGVSGTMVPANTYDPNLSTMYVLQNWNGNSGGSGYLRLYSITGAVGSEVLNNTSSGIFISTPNPWGSSGGGDFAPQLGSTNKIQTNDAGIQNLVYRNGSLWCVHTIFLPASSPTRSSVQWWQIEPTAPSIQQRGRVDDSNGNLFYAFPSIAVNGSNDVLIGYSRFSSTQYAGAAYSYRAGSDSANILRDDALLKTGSGSYYDPYDGRNRWGDYSATCVDPTNDSDLWTIQEYAAATDTWGTWWGRIGGTLIVGPANDNFANAQVISGNSGSVNGTNTNATKESGEPSHAGNVGGASVWYQWQAPNSGSAIISTAGSNFDTLLAVYTGNTVSALTSVASNDDDTGVLTSKVTFNATGGTTYRIAVDGYNGASGNITLNWSLPASTGAIATMTSPANGSTFTSTSVTFNWNPGSGNSQYYLYVGNSVGSSEYFSNYVSGGSTTVSGLPCDGRNLYVRLWSLKTNGQWLYNDYNYKASSSCLTIATMTSPANGSTFSSNTVTFTWNPGSGNSQYYLYVGNSVGSSEYFYNYVSGGSTTVSGLPCDGRNLYVRLWSQKTSGQWLYNDYNYKASSSCLTIATMTSPANGSTFSSNSVTFTWNPGSGNSQYYLYVGNSVGSSEYFSNYVSGGSTTVSGLPCDGRNLYVRLWSLTSSGWLFNDYNYKASSSCLTIATMTSPANGSTFSSNTVTFTWNPGSGNSQYYLYVGNSPGSSEYFSNYVSGGSTTVGGLACDGRNLYVRLWSLTSSGWLFNDYNYKASSSCPTIATITSPANGSTFTSTSVTFTWSLGSGNSQYFLYVGNSPGSSEYFYNYVSGGSTAVGGLPGDGRNVYVRLWSLRSSGWVYFDYSYKACACSGKQVPQITSPANGSKFGSSTVTFAWTAGIGGSQYYLYVGNSVGSSEYFYNYISGGSTTVGGLPSDGRTIYVRIWSLISGQWLYSDYAYRAVGGTSSSDQFDQIVGPSDQPPPLASLLLPWGFGGNNYSSSLKRFEP